MGDNTTLFFPVGWDWRRDFYEQSERVYNTVLAVKEETGCNPIVVGLSFGGLAAYTAFTRYGKAFSDNVHGMLYAVAPFTPMAAGAGGQLFQLYVFVHIVACGAVLTFGAVLAFGAVLDTSEKRILNSTAYEA